jgi:hypothetical protein
MGSRTRDFPVCSIVYATVCPIYIYIYIFFFIANNNDPTQPVVASGSERVNVIFSVNQRQTSFSSLTENITRIGSIYCTL